ncbi:ComEC/Rec2 family competence protein [Salinimicrobium soli]|uniref:ComEC/Rec2 family competence protein n=1 Tax=Salinimicrobium soli TaxID=1254399 RepID=UPI003AAD9410
MKPLNTTLIKLTLMFLGGIITGFFLAIPLFYLFSSLSLFLLLLLVTFLRAKKMLFQDHSFGMFSLLLFFFLGIFCTNLHLPENQNTHYIHQISAEKPQHLLKLKVSEVLKPDAYNRKYIAEVLSIDSKPSEGKILVYRKLIPQDSLQTGNIFYTFGSLEEIPAPLNPHQFDYRQYMANKEVLKQIKPDPNKVITIEKEENISSLAAQWRATITEKLSQNGLQKDELAIVQALLLGQKQDLSPEVYRNFAAAGTVHILAVSGLHVGIILLILNWLFGPLKRSKKGKILSAVFIIIFLWGFALLAGFSPSVVRAVTMFSFIGLGMQINRRTSTVNSVFLSLLVLLMIRPQFIFEPGFQLSYMAVLSIVLIQPRLARLWQPTNVFLSYFWSLLTTTLAAQIGVLPLSLYYFHQFPGLFFLSNLLILPFMGILLSGGILLVILSLLDLLPPYFMEAYSWLIKQMTDLVQWIAQQDFFIVSEIAFNRWELFGFYILIILGIVLLYSFNYKNLRTFLFGIIVLQSFYLYSSSRTSEALILFHKSNNTIIGIQKGQKLDLFSQEESSTAAMITNFRIGEDLDSLSANPFRNVYSHKGKLLLVLDSAAVQPAIPSGVDLLLLSKNPKINLERTLQFYTPELILADGSNYWNSVKRWEATCRKYGIPFYYTGEKGAFRIE